MNKVFSQLTILSLLLMGCNSSSPPPPSPTQIQETRIPPTAASTKSISVVDFSTLPVISLENVSELKNIDTLSGQTGFTGIKFSPDGQTLASFGYDDGTIRLWELASRSEYLSFRHQPQINAIAFSPDGNRIASGGTDKTVRLWDMKTGSEQAVFEGHTAGIGFKSLAWSPDGKLIAAGSRNDTIRIWKADTGEEYAVLHGHYNEITGISFSPDSTLLASASRDDSIRLWDVTTKSEREVLSGHNSDVSDIAFSPDGTTLASISGDITEKDTTVRLWDVATGKQLFSLEGHPNSNLGSVSFSPDSLLLVTTGGFRSDGSMHIYDVKTGELVAALEESNEGIVGISFSPDGRLIAASSAVGDIQLWGVVRDE